MLDFEVKYCKCGKQYVIDENTSKSFIRYGLCDDCYFIKVYGTDVHAINRKKLVIQDWEDKRIAKQWEMHSKTKMAILLSKCDGCNYKN